MKKFIAKMLKNLNFFGPLSVLISLDYRQTVHDLSANWRPASQRQSTNPNTCRVIESKNSSDWLYGSFRK